MPTSGKTPLRSGGAGTAQRRPASGGPGSSDRPTAKARADAGHDHTALGLATITTHLGVTTIDSKEGMDQDAGAQIAGVLDFEPAGQGETMHGSETVVELPFNQPSPAESLTSAVFSDPDQTAPDRGQFAEPQPITPQRHPARTKSDGGQPTQEHGHGWDDPHLGAVADARAKPTSNQQEGSEEGGMGQNHEKRYHQRRAEQRWRIGAREPE